LVGQIQEVRLRFAQRGAGALVATVFVSELAQAGALVRAHHISMGDAALAARQDPSDMRLAPGAPAVGLSTAAFLEIESALGHGRVAQKMAKEPPEGVMRTAQLLSELGDVSSHLRVII
jgi:hypothetical protein